MTMDIIPNNKRKGSSIEQKESQSRKKSYHDVTEGPIVAEQSEETDLLRDLLRVERGRARLLVDKETLQCAIQKGCVPCIYKLFPRGHPDIKAPNQRYILVS
jgi:hypothetical protein